MFTMFRLITTILALGVSAVGGLSQTPFVGTVNDMPASAEDIRQGTYLTEVVVFDYSETGRPLVHPQGGGVPIECLGKPNYKKIGTSPAIIKYDGNSFSCRFSVK